MIKRKTLSKANRLLVYNKYNGRCAYCGKEIEYKDMQVDHLIPIQRERFNPSLNNKIEDINNLMPSCRRCNNYKRAHSLQTFRRYIEEIPKKLMKTSFIYKVGIDYDLINHEEHPIKFYFETQEKDS